MKTQYGGTWTAEDKQLYKELMAQTCRCGGHKRAGMSHCPTCYRKLPKDLQRKLYRRIGDGYTQAFNESLQYLTTPEAK